MAGFLAANHISTGLLVLPVETARDAGLALLLTRVLLAAGAGLALASLARALALPRAATLAAAILYELAAPATGLTGWSALLVLLAVPAFLAALERNLGPRSAVLRLATAISIVATVCTGPVATAVLVFGALWLAVRLFPPAPVRRTEFLRRVVLAALLAVLLTFPLLVLDLPFRLAGLVAPFGNPSLGLPDLSILTAPVAARSLAPLISLAPALGLAGLAVRPGARGRNLRLLLAAATAAALAATIAGAAEALAVLLGCLALLSAIAIADLARLDPAAPGRRAAIALALLLSGGAAFAAHPIAVVSAAIGAAGLLVTLGCAVPSRWPAAVLACVAATAAIAIALAP